MDNLVAGLPGSGTRSWYLRLFVPLLALACLVSACSSPPATVESAQTRALAADLRALRTSDGLLYPPELWSALSVSYRSEVLHNMALAALGEKVSWSLPSRQLYAALAKETDPLTAASLLADADLEPGVDGPTVRTWLAQAQRSVTGDEALERLWKAVKVANRKHIDVQLSDAARDAVAARVADASPLIQRQAFDILTAAGASPSSVPTSEEWRRRIQSTEGVPDPQIVVRELESWVALYGGPHGLNLSANYWRPLLDWVSGNDETYAYSIRAFVRAGYPSFAREIAARFDTRRLLDGGRVLEPAVFSGSVGSTFRIVRYLHDGPGTGALGDSGGLISTVKPLMNRDLGHHLAGVAVSHLLRPDPIPMEERSALIASAVAQIGVTAKTPMSADKTMAWLSIADYAIAIDVPIEFPGLSPAAVKTLKGPGDDRLYAVARLLLALNATGHIDSPAVRALADHLGKSMKKRNIASLNSLLLFAGSLALLKVKGVAPFADQQLIDERDLRRGRCLGGFETFVRELRATGSLCNVEATRYGNALPQPSGP